MCNELPDMAYPYHIIGQMLMWFAYCEANGITGKDSAMKFEVVTGYDKSLEGE